MSIIHFLNVLEGDCNIIQHDSDRVTVIDMSNAYDQDDTPEEAAVKASQKRAEMKARTGVPPNKTNYRQKEHPDNPIDYLTKINVDTIFRFIITHPDMDHLDGIKDLYKNFAVLNTWDTDNTKFIDVNNFFAGYNKDDWKFYTDIRDGRYTGGKRLTNYDYSDHEYWPSDYLKILCPTEGLVQQANENESYHDLSYVLLYTPPKRGGGIWKILFAGDSEDRSWDYILEQYADAVTDIDILFAPHHGRDSGRDFGFIDILNPKITLFGNASSAHLAYTKYPEIRITNNQAGYVILDISESRIEILVKNQEFARDFRLNPKRNFGEPVYNNTHEAWPIGQLNA
ncbi:MBL fold metallo-hydrolase [Mucilaginibacter sp. AK015]|uniref:MBL fold metallo-hydrolase n=1 Tax=Mucilaginibacter sp. AK015 TaxID=2723072 RepID=UPI00160E720C|nr:MBL fold metallo-hydrolase [Mucilaginibacter sp. AK015]MBB5397187.1 beta-lactamase superfamily II metal-dependent hydrolase [Mucilaginibacter sp. AK015]